MLALPATAAQVLASVVVPAMKILPASFDSPEARVELLAIACQEAGSEGSIRWRTQINGPAHGMWQNEEEGVTDVLNNPASAARARMLCAYCAIAPGGVEAYWALPTNDIFACGIARLMLFCDPNPLPALGNVDDAWICYQKNWGPGKPRPQDWSANYAAALAAVDAFGQVPSSTS